MPTIDIAADCLTDGLAMLAGACRVVGSEARDNRVVRLIIEGEGVPTGHVTATVTYGWDGNTHHRMIAFTPA